VYQKIGLILAAAHYFYNSDGPSAIAAGQAGPVVAVQSTKIGVVSCGIKTPVSRNNSVIYSISDRPDLAYSTPIAVSMILILKTEEAQEGRRHTSLKINCLEQCAM
jgi:hypothetical protein